MVNEGPRKINIKELQRDTWNALFHIINSQEELSVRISISMKVLHLFVIINKRQVQSISITV
jgi:hypothetical protein